MKKTFAFCLSLIILLSLGGFVVSAQNTSTTDEPTTRTTDGPTTRTTDIGFRELENPFRNADTLDELLNLILNDIVLPIGGILAVLAFIYSGFLYVTAQGNESKLAKAHSALLYTAIGTAVLLGAAVIASVIGNTVEQLKEIP